MRVFPRPNRESVDAILDLISFRFVLGASVDQDRAESGYHSIIQSGHG